MKGQEARYSISKAFAVVGDAVCLLQYNSLLKHSGFCYFDPALNRPWETWHMCRGLAYL